MRSQDIIAIKYDIAKGKSDACMKISRFLFMEIPWLDRSDSIYWTARDLETLIEMSS